MQHHICENWGTFGRSGRNRPKSHGADRLKAKVCPNQAKFGRVGPSSADAYQTLTQIGLNLAKTLAEFCPFSPIQDDVARELATGLERKKVICRSARMDQVFNGRAQCTQLRSNTCMQCWKVSSFSIVDPADGVAVEAVSSMTESECGETATTSGARARDDAARRRQESGDAAARRATMARARGPTATTRLPMPPRRDDLR